MKSESDVCSSSIESVAIRGNREGGNNQHIKSITSTLQSNEKYSNGPKIFKNFY